MDKIKLESRGKMYLVYGIGEYGKAYLEKCKEYGIKDVIAADSDAQLWGTTCCEYDVLKPEQAFRRTYDLIIITVESLFARKEIAAKIRPMSSNTRIVSAGRTLIWNDKVNYNLGNIVLKQKIKTGIYTLEKFKEYVDLQSFNDIEKFVFNKNHTRINKEIHYFEAYDRFFEKYRNKQVNILEIGVRGGGSMQLWRDYFGENAKIFGIDINPICKQYEDEHIHIFIGSQEDRRFLQMIKEKIGFADVIIDDGGHMMNQHIVSFEELWPIVNPGGVYLCEDTITSYFKSCVSEYKKDTFIEYTKNLIDSIHAGESEFEESVINNYTKEVKSISYYHSMVFIEKMEAKDAPYDLIVDEMIEL